MIGNTDEERKLQAQARFYDAATDVMHALNTLLRPGVVTRTPVPTPLNNELRETIAQQSERIHAQAVTLGKLTEGIDKFKNLVNYSRNYHETSGKHLDMNEIARACHRSIVSALDNVLADLNALLPEVKS